MRDTVATLPSRARHPNVASPHYLIDDRVRVIRNASVDAVAPAGSVWSSIDDMAKWMRVLLDGGRLVGGGGSRRLLSETTVAELFKPQAIAPQTMYPTTRLIKPHWMTYGLGWFQQDYRGRAVDFHTGSIDGMVAIHGLIRDNAFRVKWDAEWRTPVLATFNVGADGRAGTLEMFGARFARKAD